MSGSDYLLIDSGDGQKLERFGAYTLARPCAQAIWRRQRPEWSVDATFSRAAREGWSPKGALPASWKVDVAGLTLLLRATDFGHLGLFPEQIPLWEWMGKQRPKRVLNLFGYSGVATLIAARSGASVTHLDASHGMCQWARDNATLNRLEGAAIRWIADDVLKFLTREVRRGQSYDAILLDPPTFGRGSRGEVFKIERDLLLVLDRCAQLLAGDPHYVILSCHTPGYGSLSLQHLLTQLGLKGGVIAGDLLLQGEGLAVPSGAYAIWAKDA